jgi:hypothetical protein
MNGISSVFSNSNTQLNTASLPQLNQTNNQQSLVTPNSDNDFASSDQGQQSSGSNFLDSIKQFFGDLMQGAGQFFQGMLTGGPLGGLMSMVKQFMPGL